MSLRSFSDHLFGFDRDETFGEVVFFKAFEAFIVYASLYLAWEWGYYILRISDVVLPLGIAQYIDVSFLFGNSLSLWNAGLITAAALIGFFRGSSAAYMVAFLLLHLQYAARYSLGEIPHSSNVTAMVLLGLGLATLLFKTPKEQRRFTLGFSYFFIPLGYTLAAFCKIIGTGLAWSDGRHLWMWVNEKGIDAFAKFGVLDYNLLQDLVLADYWVATLFLTIGLVSEFCAFLMWWRPFRVPVGLAIIGLHLGIYFVMNIMFGFTLCIIILLTFPWSRWIDRWSKRERPRLEPA